MGNWLLLKIDSDVHIIPKRDLVAHEAVDECVCVPRTEPVTRLNGSIAWMYVHHSLDGREAKE